MRELESFVWDRACHVRYPLGTLVPPWEGDRMLSAIALADSSAAEGGIRQIVATFDDHLPIAAEAYRYFGFANFALGLDVIAAHHGEVTATVLRSAFRKFGMRWRLAASVGEGFELVNARYFTEVSPRIAGAFGDHFQTHRDDYGPAGHPSTWN